MSDPSPKYLLDPVGTIVQAEDDLVDLRDLLHAVDLIVQERPIEDGYDGLGRVECQWPKAGALPSSEQNRLHDNRQSYTIESERNADGPAGMNLPNSLTVVRMFLVPLLVVVLLTEFEGRQIFGVSKALVGAAIFGLASLTDFLDGYLARRRRQVTWLGQILDPIADKLLTSAAFISLVQVDLVPAWMVALIIGREFAITGLRSLAYTRGITIPASWLGKIKMGSQVGAILMVLVGWAGVPWLALAGQVAMWVVMLTAVVSALDYYRRFQTMLSARVTDVNVAPDAQGQLAATRTPLFPLGDVVADHEGIARNGDLQRRRVVLHVDGNSLAKVEEKVVSLQLVAEDDEARAWRDALRAPAVEDEEVALGEHRAAVRSCQDASVVFFLRFERLL